MADAYKDGKAMPEIIDNTNSADMLNNDLSQLISQMVSFESSKRPLIEEVTKRLGKYSGLCRNIFKYADTWNINLVIYTFIIYI